jgi:hypothetical protein
MLSPIFGEDEVIMFVRELSPEEQTETPEKFSLSIVKLRSMTPTIFASVNEAEDHFLNKLEGTTIPVKTAPSIHIAINRAKNTIAANARRGVANVVLLGSKIVAELDGSPNNKNIGRWSGLDIQSPIPTECAYYTSTDINENDIFVIYNKGNYDAGAIINVDAGISLYEHSGTFNYGHRITV